MHVVRSTRILRGQGWTGGLAEPYVDRGRLLYTSLHMTCVIKQYRTWNHILTVLDSGCLELCWFLPLVTKWTKLVIRWSKQVIIRSKVVALEVETISVRNVPIDHNGNGIS